MADQENFDPESSFVVRAKFDFTATDGSALSFNEGNIIQVFSKLESGWWDGMLDGRRGWFPSNYVDEINEDEVVVTEVEYEREQEPEPEGSMLNVDDVLRGDWGGDWGGAGLEQLAREMMEGNEGQDDGVGFMVEAQRRKAQLNNDMTDEFGLTAKTAAKTVLQDDTLKAHRISLSEVPKDAEEGEDAWIPSITPDGQASPSPFTLIILRFWLTIPRCTTTILKREKTRGSFHRTHLLTLPILTFSQTTSFFRP